MEEEHAQPLVHVRGVLRVVPQHERLQSEELLIGDISIEVHAQARFDPAPAARPARPNPYISHHVALPAEIAGAVRVVEVVVLQ